ncbi:MAG: hypothetical protein JJ975_13650, partial [Bacteroidia bacterium]|nr:hypothetical protein [Bacteroidia bacterium]
MKKYLLPLLALGLFLIPPGMSKAQTFSGAKIDDGDGCNWPFSSTTSAPNGDIYMFWRDGSGTGAVFKLLRWTGSAWTSVGSFNMTTVASSLNFNSASDYVSLAIDGSGNYHVVFGASKTGSCCSQPRGFAYGYSSNGTSWTFETIISYTDPSGWKNIYDPSVRVDKNGIPHVAGQFTNSNNSVSFMGSTYNRLYTVKYFKRTAAPGTSGTWGERTPYHQGGASNEVGSVSFDLDTSGLAHFAFTAETNGSGLDPSLFYVFDSTGTVFSKPKKLIAGNGSSSPYTYEYEGIGNQLEIDPTTNKVYIVSTNYQGRLKMTTNASGSFSTSVVNSAASSYRGGFNITSGGAKFIGAYIGSGFQSIIQTSGSSSWTVSSGSINAGGGGYFPSAHMNNSGTIMFVYDRPPSGSCGASNPRTIHYGVGSFSICSNPTTPPISISPSSACSGTSRTISVTAGSLNDATSWKLYTGSCGGTQIDTTTGTTFTVSPTSTTQYWVRGSGGCTTPSACDNVTATITTPGNASFSYGSSSYCTNDSDPTPSTSSSGTFSSTAGLVFVSTSTGQIDVSASTPGTYTVTHTVNPCAATATASITIKSFTTATISPSVCDSYTSPSGKTWTTSNTYMDTIPNAANCDSIITINLTIRTKTFATINPDVCDSYTSPSGKTWTTSNTYMDTIPNAANCDSVITVNLTIRRSTTALINPDVCDSYTSPSGKTWTSTGVYMDTIPNAANCDSVITVNLTIRNKTFATINPDVCDSYTSPSGKTWTTSNTYMDTIPNAANCDSVITVNLTVRHKTFATIAPDECDSFISPSGKTWTTTGIYMDTIPNAANCDSVITVNLTIRYASSSSIDITEYDSIVLPSGRVIYTSGTYMDTIPNAMLCDSVMTIQCRVINRLKTWDFPTLDEAIDSANQTINTVEIFIEGGTYYPGGQSNTNRDSAYMITNPNVGLYGGFTGTETDKSQANPMINRTILCGDVGVAGDSTDNLYHVVVISAGTEDVDSNLVLDGLIIRDGNANGNTKTQYNGEDVYRNEGAGLLITGGTGAEVNPTINNCSFENNYASYGSAIYIKVENGTSAPTICNTTIKNNNGLYGAVYNDGISGNVSPYIKNCAFVDNTAKSAGAALYNYGYLGVSSPKVENTVFSGNVCEGNGGAVYNNGYLGSCTPTYMNNTFFANSTILGAAGAMYNFGQTGTCTPATTNTIFYKNIRNTFDLTQFSEFKNLDAYPNVTYSSVQLSSSSYSAAMYNSLGTATGNIYGNNPNFESTTNLDGDDDVWRTGDDGLRLSSTSPLINQGTNTGAPTTDILGGNKVGTRDMGAYEYITCGLNVALATDVTTHTATQAVNDGNFTCYCNADNELLLALDTNGSGAVITPSQVQLYIGNPSTLSYNTSGGMITNPAGGVILERRWDVSPTTQPGSNVRVRYFYTNDEYNDVVTAMAALTSPTTISAPSQLQFYKVKGGSTATFPNPHDAGVYGIVLSHGAAADTNVWVSGTHGVQDHTADYLVSSFSGGGGGGGGGAAPLPVELIKFTAQAASNHTGQLDWSTATEVDNSHFVLERSYNAY